MVSNRFMRSAVVCAVAFAFFVFLFSCAKKMQSDSQGSQSGSVSPAASSVLKFANAEEELEAWKKEPRYNDTLRYFISDGCTAGVVVADKKGFYAKEGLKVEGFKGKSDVEALGLGKADVAIGHISKQLVPAVNGTDLVFVGGAHRLSGCKTLVVPANSPIKYIEDLKGKRISCPNGRGASDFNITARLLDAYGIDPLHDVEIKVIENSASVPAMERGDVDCAILGESFVYDMVREGRLRKVNSKDGMSTNQICCAITMNGTFVKENPITAGKMARAIRNALDWMRENPEEATDFLLKEGLNSGSREKNIELNALMSFGMYSNIMTEGELRAIANDYVRIGLIVTESDAGRIMDRVWRPLGE